MRRLRETNVSIILAALVLFILASFALLAFSKGGFSFVAVIFALSVILLILIMYMALYALAPHADRLLFTLVAFLLSIGLVVQFRLDVNDALHQLIVCAAGAVAFSLVLLVMRRPLVLRALTIPMALVSLAILSALLFVGKESGGATNWISVAGVLVQPSEFVKVALIIVLADAMSVSTEIRKLVPCALFAVASAVLLVLERDLGAAALVAAVFLVMFYTASGNIRLTLMGAGATSLAAVGSYFLFDHVKVRIAVWQDPWATYSTSGYQIAQGLMAIASGGLFGMGLGLGSPTLIPAYGTDYVFAVISEEFGMIFAIGMIAIYLLIVVRMAIAALKCENAFLSLCAFGASSLIAVQTFIIIGGVIKLIPLTGITLPFVSYGGSSMLASMALVALVEGVASYNGEALEEALDEADEDYGRGEET